MERLGELTGQPLEQAAELVTIEAATEGVVCGDDAGEHADMSAQCVDAGYDEVYVQPIGPDQQRFLDFYSEHVLPRCT